MTKKLTVNSRGVTHHSENRTRLRLPKNQREKHKLNNVKKRLEKVPGVQAVEVNERTGSILVHSRTGERDFTGDDGLCCRRSLPGSI